MPQEYVARWTGARVGAGASVFHFESIASGTAATALAGYVRGMFDAIKGNIPDDVTISFDGEMKELDNSGTLIAVYPVTVPSTVSGTYTGSFANGSGIVVRHNTGAIVNGRRLIGRTFIVPAGHGSFQNNGEVLPVAQAGINTAFVNLRTSANTTGANFAVWSRKNGTVAPVSSSQTLSRPSTLRTRNDYV